MTRRVTLVRYLRGENGFDEVQLKAAFAISTTAGFLTQAQTLGISNGDLADRLVAFKTAGGSGLANAIELITAEFNASNEPECNEQLQGILDQLDALRAQVAAALA